MELPIPVASPIASPTPLLGALVLLRINYDPPVYRPLLVTNSWTNGGQTSSGEDYPPGEYVSGELFLSWEVDRITEWCRSRLFEAPSRFRRTAEVPIARHGPGLGEWVTQAEYDRALADAQARLAQAQAAAAPAPSAPSEGENP